MISEIGTISSMGLKSFFEFSVMVLVLVLVLDRLDLKEGVPRFWGGVFPGGGSCHEDSLGDFGQSGLGIFSGTGSGLGIFLGTGSGVCIL